MWRQNLVTRIEKAFKTNQHRQKTSHWVRHGKEPGYEIDVTPSGTEITMDDPKLACAVYEQLKKKRPNEVVVFNVQRLRCPHCGWRSAHLRAFIRLPAKGQTTSDFVVAEFSKRLKTAVGRSETSYVRSE